MSKMHARVDDVLNQANVVLGQLSEAAAELKKAASESIEASEELRQDIQQRAAAPDDHPKENGAPDA